MAMERLIQASAVFLEGQRKGVIWDGMAAARAGRGEDAADLFHRAMEIKAGTMKVETLLKAINLEYQRLGFDPLPIEALELPSEAVSAPVPAPSEEKVELTAKVLAPEPERSSLSKPEKPTRKNNPKLSDTQRRFLDIAFGLDESGEIKYPDRASRLKAYDPQGYTNATTNPDNVHSLPLIQAHYGRSAHSMESLILRAFTEPDKAPRELVRRLEEIKANPAFAGRSAKELAAYCTV